MRAAILEDERDEYGQDPDRDGEVPRASGRADDHGERGMHRAEEQHALRRRAGVHQCGGVRGRARRRLSGGTQRQHAPGPRRRRRTCSHLWAGRSALRFIAAGSVVPSGCDGMVMDVEILGCGECDVGSVVEVVSASRVNFKEIQLLETTNTTASDYNGQSFRYTSSLSNMSSS